MEKKNLRKTEGLPFTLGMIGGVLLLLETILTVNLKSIETQATLSAMNLPATSGSAASVSGLIGTVISFLIYPGIFLLLLLLGKNKEKRGSAFATVWIVISGISIISSIASTVALKKVLAQIASAVDTVMPGGYWIQNGLALAGCVLVIASCSVFLKRLHETPVAGGPDVPPAESGTADGNP